MCEKEHFHHFYYRNRNVLLTCLPPPIQMLKWTRCWWAVNCCSVPSSRTQCGGQRVLMGYPLSWKDLMIFTSSPTWVRPVYVSLFWKSWVLQWSRGWRTGQSTQLSCRSVKAEVIWYVGIIWFKSRSVDGHVLVIYKFVTISYSVCWSGNILIFALRWWVYQKSFFWYLC